MAHHMLANKVAIITGGNSGIGLASAKLFASEGAKVVIAARNEETGAAIVAEINQAGPGEAIFIQTNVANPADVESLVDQTMAHYGRVDILYGNSGIFPAGDAMETSVYTWHQVIETNLGGQFFLAKFGIPALIQSGGGVILFTSSELGTVGTTRAVAYCASKGGLINMARAIAVDCAPYHIRVNCIAPGPIETPMKRAWINKAPDPEALEESQTQPVLLKRFGTPEEAAQVALFLASDASSYMTGSVVIADGGCTAWYGL
jgi:NAD(P)-dependent dehydrogenase (short-subunit alcohol dehydrogenase family)